MKDRRKTRLYSAIIYVEIATITTATKLNCRHKYKKNKKLVWTLRAFACSNSGQGRIIKVGQEIRVWKGQKKRRNVS